MKTLDEEILLKNASEGDSESFSSLEISNRDKVISYTNSIINNPHDAEDIYQKAITKAWLKVSKFRGDCTFSTWLCQICFNLARDEFRKRKRKPTVRLNDLKASGTSLEDLLSRSANTKQRSPLEEVVSNETRAEIVSFIYRLPQKHKQVLVMSAIKNMSHKEIASELNIPKGTVMSRIFHARKLFNKIRKDKYENRN
tara:strand:- start:156 stop:749 length:594 start_codon:yes stop_codon:yes gene_type:complete